MKISTIIIKRAVLLIWALWSSLVTLSNAADALRNLGILPGNFKFVSGNFGFIQAATQIYAFPVWINALLFALVICWEAAMGIYFFKAFFALKSGGTAASNLPFLFGVILFGGFAVMDEFLIAYDRLGSIEQTHISIFVAMLVSFIAVKLLPND